MTAYENPVNKMMICAGPLQFNFQNALRIVEHVEVYKLLGAHKFYIYNASVDKNVDKVLNYYKNRGDIEVLQFHLNDSEYF